MPTLSERIWFGEAVAGDQKRIVVVRPLLLLTAGLALVAGRLALPFQVSDSMLMYEALARGMLEQENWARQALVGVLEYPPLPTVALIVLSPLTRLLQVQGGTLMTAVAQVWTLLYFGRTLRLFARSPVVWVLALPLLLLPGAGQALFEADPFWVYLVPLAAIFFHACRWERNNSLRDVVFIAINCGILVFGGIAGILVAVNILLVTWLRGAELGRRKGGFTLFFMPFFYALLLYPLFNWLIMGDALFMLRRLAGFFQADLVAANLAGLPRRVQFFLILAPAISFFTLFIKGVPLHLRLSLQLCLAVALMAGLRIAGNIFIGGEFLLGGFLAVPAIVFLLFLPTLRDRGWGLLIFLVFPAVFCLLASYELRRHARQGEEFIHPAPAAAEVVALVDRYWPRGRILVFNLRAAAIYKEQAPERFWPHLDYHEKWLRELIRGEQLHLLLPPDNGRFYPRGNSTMAAIHNRGRDWLFLEKQWPSGWQLWRCIRPRAPTAADLPQHAE